MSFVPEYQSIWHGRIFYIIVTFDTPSAGQILVETYPEGKVVVTPSQTGEFLKVTAQGIEFKLDCRNGVQPVKIPEAMKFRIERIKVQSTSQSNTRTFKVRVEVGTDEDDSAKVTELLDEICKAVDLIESKLDKLDRLGIRSHEQLKWAIAMAVETDQVIYEFVSATMAQKAIVSRFVSLCCTGSDNRNKAVNGSTTPLPLSDNECDEFLRGLRIGEIGIRENSMIAEDARKGNRAALGQLIGSIAVPTPDEEFIEDSE
ncbi:hypothetical protein BGZ60DRAFT_529962 [Tricladium varicosporioides]|nr:hypothetical protein BGZ60DRAFT_529962 [Hymenoscyphus varicosporioides]